VASSSITLLYNTGTNLLTLNLASGVVLPAGDYRLTLVAAGIADINGQSLSANVSTDFHVLPGDANGDRVVNDRDLFAVWQNSLRPLAQQDLNADVNGDGRVTAADVQVIKSFYLTKVPTATSPGGGGQGSGAGTQMPLPAETAAASLSVAPAASAAAEGNVQLSVFPGLGAAPLAPMEPAQNEVAVEPTLAARPLAQVAPRHDGAATEPARTDTAASPTGTHSTPAEGRAAGWVPFRWPSEGVVQTMPATDRTSALGEWGAGSELSAWGTSREFGFAVSLSSLERELFASASRPHLRAPRTRL
jgi:hypothetical protein